jgi:hypothetical protein
VGENVDPGPVSGRAILGQTLKVLREKAGKSLGQLAEDTGYDKSYLSRLESGERLSKVTVLPPPRPRPRQQNPRLPALGPLGRFLGGIRGRDQAWEGRAHVRVTRGGSPACRVVRPRMVGLPVEWTAGARTTHVEDARRLWS